MFYLAIPQSQMNRSEVKSLLADAEDKKDLSPVKSEPTDVAVQEQEETIEGSTVSTTGPIFFYFSNPACIFRWFKFTLKPPYSIALDNLRFAIWDTSFWTIWLKFGHKGL